MDCMAVEKRLMDALACPRCKGAVAEKGMFVTCAKCSLAYPVLDGSVPDMLAKDAWKLGRARKAGFRHALKL